MAKRKQLSNRLRRVSNNRRSQSGGRANAIVAPAPFQASLTFSKKFRFSVADPTSITLNSVQIVQFISLPKTPIPASGTVALIDRFKIRKVEIFGPMAQDLVPVTVKLEYLSQSAGFTTSSKLYSDTSMSSAGAAHLNVAPEPESLASKWVSYATSVDLVRLTVPAQAIVDITLDIVLNDGGPMYQNTAPVQAGTSQSIGTRPPTGWSSLGLPNILS